MEDYEYDVGKRYAQILKIMWFTFFYATIIPIGAFISLLGIGLYFWVDKYNFLRRSSLHYKVNHKLTYLALRLLEFSLFFRVLG